ncbi:MAG: polyprenyl synthetase family protein, partial [Clostridiales bacterium]|nr:polyprenyl synthetase family protein [Clostridiales bacterium]
MENLILNVEGLSEELSCVDSYIGEFLGTRPETGAMDDIFRSIRSTRGKMIRPLLLLLAARFGPQRTARRQHLCKLGALVEIVHMASLVHDDIIDDSPLRRGRATIQQQFGKDMAVYAGDFMISRVLRHLSTEQMLQEGLIIANTIEDMCCGELGQMTCRWNTETTTDMYLSNIYGKSVAIFVGALQLGGMGSESPKETVDCLVKIGRHMGFMYQMRDDLLDF